MLLDDTKTVWEEVGEGERISFFRLGGENITLRGYLRQILFLPRKKQFGDRRLIDSARR